MKRESTYPCRAQFSVMGVPTLLAADQAPLLRAAIAATAGWESLPEPTPMEPLRIWLRTAASTAEPHSGGDIQVNGRRLRLDGSGIQGEADADAREAWCIVPPELVADPATLADELLDTILLFLLTRSGRLPLHAAGILLGETAVLLAGPSGAGKSTLALAADRAGVPVISEDTVYVQLQPRFRVWGSPRAIHLLPGSGALDADSMKNSGVALRHRNGRWKIAVPVNGARFDDLGADRSVLCLLDRGERVSLCPLEPARAIQRLMSSLDPGFDHFRQELPAMLAAVTGAGAWTLTLSSDPEAAISALRQQFGG